MNKKFELEPKYWEDESRYNNTLILFGKSVKCLPENPNTQVQVKITDRCNAYCPFCIEQGSSIPENREVLLESVNTLLKELTCQGRHPEVTITGGEPSLCKHTPDVMRIAKKYGCPVNINTNFHKLVDCEVAPVYLNISRHACGDDRCCGLHKIDRDMLETVRKKWPDTKISIVCVLYNKGLQSIDDVFKFMDYYGEDVDEFYFRGLMQEDANRGKSYGLLDQIRSYMHKNANLKGQVTSETHHNEYWQYKDHLIVTAACNMGREYELESREPENLIRQFIVHPDGMVSGSWSRERKVLRRG